MIGTFRLTVTASCPMYLQLFPMDSQECTLEIESYGYSEDDIKYAWKPPRADTFKLDEEVRLPQFDVKNFTVVSRTQRLSTGDYSRLSVKLLFVRNIGFYMMQIYLPSMLIVIISWVSFWIHRDASPARVALGVTTVLTMTTLMSTTNASLPKVSYIKAIDIYLGTCFVMVFASLLEYAAVSYLNKKLKMKRERKKQENVAPATAHNNNQQQANASIATAVSANNSGANNNVTVMDFPPLHATSRIGSPASLLPPTHNPSSALGYYPTPAVHPDYQRLLASSSLSHSPYHQLECDCDLAVRPIPLKMAPPPLRPQKSAAQPAATFRRRRVTGVTPSAIDKYSRFVFPVVFFFFNVLYWTSCYLISQRSMDEIIQGYESMTNKNTTE